MRGCLREGGAQREGMRREGSRLCHDTQDRGGEREVYTFLDSTFYIIHSTFYITSLRKLAAAEPEEEEAEEDEGEVEGFGSQVLLMKEEGSDAETDEDAAPSNHGNYGDKGCRKT